MVIVSGFLGFRIADPMLDAAARSICSTYANDHGLVLIEANGASAAEERSGTSPSTRAGSSTQRAPRSSWMRTIA
jgi:hypothetical protein